MMDDSCLVSLGNVLTTHALNVFLASLNSLQFQIFPQNSQVWYSGSSTRQHHLEESFRPNGGSVVSKNMW